MDLRVRCHLLAVYLKHKEQLSLQDLQVAGLVLVLPTLRNGPIQDDDGRSMFLSPAQPPLRPLIQPQSIKRHVAAYKNQLTQPPIPAAGDLRSNWRCGILAKSKAFACMALESTLSDYSRMLNKDLRRIITKTLGPHHCNALAVRSVGSLKDFHARRLTEQILVPNDVPERHTYMRALPTNSAPVDGNGKGSVGVDLAAEQDNHLKQ